MPEAGWLAVVPVVMMASLVACAGDIYVNNKAGDDRNPGTEQAPFQTLRPAAKAMRTGDTLHLANTGEPYRRREHFDHLAFWYIPGGSQDKPTVIDGHGATITGLTHYQAGEWKDEGNQVFSLMLSNNYHTSRSYWVGFDLVFFDGKPGINGETRASLVAGGYFLHANAYFPAVAGKREPDPLRNTLYVRLPDGKTPADIKIEAPGGDGIVSIGSDHVTVRNLTSMYSCNDGFSSSKNVGVRFENVRGCYNMDQGMSHHGTTKATVVDSRFDHNANCGIVDVYPEAEVTYRDCVIEDNPFQGGVEFHRGKFVMENCVIRNNVGPQLNVVNDADVTLINCFLGRTGDVGGGIFILSGTLSLKQSTVYGVKTGVEVVSARALRIDHSAFIGCETLYDFSRWRGMSEATLDLDDNFLQSKRVAYPGTNLPSGDVRAFIDHTGLDRHSMVEVFSGPLPPLTNSITGRDGTVIGARLDGGAMRRAKHDRD